VDNRLSGIWLVKGRVNGHSPKLSPQLWSVGRKAQCARSRQLLAVSCGGGEASDASASVISGVGPGGRRPHSPVGLLLARVIGQDNQKPGHVHT